MGTITLRNKKTAGAGLAVLEVGEVALNTIDEQMYMRDSLGTSNALIGTLHSAEAVALDAAALTDTTDGFIRKTAALTYRIDTPAQATAALDLFATGSTVQGLVPGSNSGGASVFLNGSGAWSVPGGGGDVSKVGTPADNQIGVWTGIGTIEGDAAFTFDTTTDLFNIGATNDGTIQIGGTTFIDNAAGTITLSNINNYGLLAGDIPDLSATYEVIDATIIKEADLNTSITLAAAANTEAASALAIKTYVDDQVAGGSTYKGGFDPTAAAGAGSPNLDTVTSAVGDMYTVTVSGTYNWTTGSAALEIGDVLIAESSGVLNNVVSWTIVNKNLGAVAPDINSTTTDSAPDIAADFMMFYDTTEGVHNKLLIQDIAMDGGTWA